MPLSTNQKPESREIFFMKAIGIENLRCLSNTGLIELKPITVLVGQNSSGKSTFLIPLPLGCPNLLKFIARKFPTEICSQNLKSC